ncbi:MAG: NifB/NifX family molybdenum-iron cluster-binding protein, partial [Victivallaceae bacterium]
MARPIKERIICPQMQEYCFLSGKIADPLLIPVDELEALRLCDLEEKSQGEAADLMRISRGTLQRLLYAAHRKIAFALLNGNPIITQGNEKEMECGRQNCRFCSRKYKQRSIQGVTTMKFAVTCEDGMVFQHFGHTPEFAVFTVENNQIVNKDILSCGESGHGALAGLLQQDGIELLICGGIGGGAQMALAEAGIKLIGGASGLVDEVAANFMADKLQVNPDFHCNHHHH